MTKSEAYVITANDLQSLFDILIARGYTPVGPRVREGVIVYDELRGVQDLPKGLTDNQDAGTYRLNPRDDGALFGFNNGPHSWKKYLFPPSSKLWEADKTQDGGFSISETEDNSKPYAFIGVRSCDLAAMQVQDQVFMGDRPDLIYSSRRRKSLIIVVQCGQAAKTCFCTSMNTGPRATAGYDLALTEILDGDDHYFVAEPGSNDGVSLLEGISHSKASKDNIDAARECTKRAEEQMGRKIDISDIKALLYRHYDDERWQALEKRCLACGNCTMVCPTCFCSKVEDVTDLTGQHAERWREWDSCFTMDFSYLHGGSVRQSIGSRYRHWLMHKLATWLDQFGTSGCVGCGRCITWCPVGIDLTEEVRLIRQNEQQEELPNSEY